MASNTRRRKTARIARPSLARTARLRHTGAMRFVVLFLLALGFAACSRDATAPSEATAIASRAERDPAAVVRPLYDRYLREGEPAPALNEAAPWTDDLRAAIEATLAYSRAVGEPIIDFDPLIDAQDFQLSNLRVEVVQQPQEDRAIVEARFSNIGRTTIVYYDMRAVDGAWRVDNVRTPDWNLRDITRQSAAAAPRAPSAAIAPTAPRGARNVYDGGAPSQQGAKPNAKPD